MIHTGRVVNEWPATNARERRALADLSHARLNFDPSRRHEFTSANGWHLDQRREPLPAEPSGPPVSGGSWETACRLMRGYEFADPTIVRAFYNPEEPLEGRNMLLELRFWGLRFLVGTRVSSEYEETRTLDGGEVHVWGGATRRWRGISSAARWPGRYESGLKPARSSSQSVRTRSAPRFGTRSCGWASFCSAAVSSFASTT